MFDFQGLFITLNSMGFVNYFVTFLLVFTATYYLFLQVPLLSKDNSRKKLALIMGLATGLIFVSNQDYVEALKTTIMDYSYIIIMVVFIALIVASIFYIQENYKNP